MKQIALALIVAALAVTACGRKGALQRVEGTAPPPTVEAIDGDEEAEQSFETTF